MFRHLLDLKTLPQAKQAERAIAKGLYKYAKNAKLVKTPRPRLRAAVRSQPAGRLDQAEDEENIGTSIW